MKYHLSCGCTHGPETISKVNNGKSNRKVCPAHPDTRVIGRSSVCANCSSEFYFAVMGTVPVLCDTCAGRKRPKEHKPLNDDREITFVYRCGCKENSLDALKRKVGPASIRVYACAEHLEKVSHKETTCEDCGEIFRSKFRSIAPKQCPECKYGPSVGITLDTDMCMTKDLIACENRSDCIHRRACTDEHINDKCRPCLGCADYSPVEMEHDYLPVKYEDVYLYAEVG